MNVETVEKGVLVLDDGTELPFEQCPGTLEEYDRELKEARRRYPSLFARLPSMDEYYRVRGEETAGEWVE